MEVGFGSSCEELWRFAIDNDSCWLVQSCAHLPRSAWFAFCCGTLCWRKITPEHLTVSRYVHVVYPGRLQHWKGMLLLCLLAKERPVAEGGTLAMGLGRFERVLPAASARGGAGVRSGACVWRLGRDLGSFASACPCRASHWPRGGTLLPTLLLNGAERGLQR